MKNIETIKNILNKKKWSWWGQRSHDALGLSKLINFNFLVTCDWGEDIKQIWQNKVVSLELLSGKRKNYSNEDINLLLDGHYSDEVQKKLHNGTNCIMYRSLKELEKYTRHNKKVKIYSSPVRLKNIFDNKILFREKIETMGIKSIPGKVIFIRDIDFASANKMFGKKFVIKYPVASSGEKTHLVEDSDSYENLITEYTNEPVIIERFLDGYSLNVNAVVGENSSKISALSMQIIGTKTLVGKIFGFGGNDFASVRYIPTKIKEKIFNQTEKIIQWMSKWGYRGMMGIDFIVSDEKVYPVEINPRFQNSTSILTLMEIKNNISPLVYFHLIEFDHDLDIGINYNFNRSDILDASQIILHNLENHPVTVNNPIKPGIYAYEKGLLKFVRNGLSVYDCRNDNEFSVCCGVPVKGTILEPGAPIVKIQFPMGITCSNLKDLNPEIELIIKNIYNNFNGDN